MDTADSRGPDTAERVFAEFLNDREQGAALTIDDLIARHPLLADRLRTLAANYAAGDPMVAASDELSGLQARARSELSRLLERLRQRGPDGTRFLRVKPIGAGGMGEVWSARDQDLNREFALKQIGTTDAGTVAMHGADRQLRFVAEAQTLGQLQHPGIPPLHELGVQPDGRLYFAMARVSGKPLAELLERPADWPLPRLLTIVQKVCETVAYAHGKNVIHRDLKPDHVIVGEFGEVYVIDWGLARTLGDRDPQAAVVRTVRTPELNGTTEPTAAAAADAGLTSYGTVVGTPNFMAPEQAAGDVAAVDKRSDIYAVGAILYQLITGTLPYGKGKPKQILAAVLDGPPRSPGSLAPQTPKDLLAICERAMAREPADRYPTMQDLADDLRHYLEGHAVQARRITPVGRLWKWARRNRAVATTSGLALAAAGLATLAILWWFDSSAHASTLQQSLHQTEAELDAWRSHPLPQVFAPSVWTLQLSHIEAELSELLNEADLLWPARPKQIPELEAWVKRAQALLEGKAGDLLRGDLGLPGLRDLQQRLAGLRQRAKPGTTERQRHDEASHPRFQESRWLRTRATWSARMLQLEPWPELLPANVALGDGPLPRRCEDLRMLADTLGDPDAGPYDEVDRALALVDRALQIATPSERALVLATQAKVRLKRGDFAGARQAADEAVAAASTENRTVVIAKTTELRRQLADWTEQRAARERNHALWSRMADQAEREVKTPQTFQFDDVADQRVHDQLTKVVDALAELNHPERGQLTEILIEGKGLSVAHRLKAARSVERRTIHGPEAARGWGTAIPEIQKSPHYGGLTLRPQMDLLPIGEDLESGLWVFWHWGSGNLPKRDGKGRSTPHLADGITFVLIPGGRFHKGAQRDLHGAPCHDADAAPLEGPVVEIPVEPFFLAKHEITQAQWWQLAGTRPSQYGLSGYDARWNEQHRSWDATQPVERVSWYECVQILERNSLTLPTDTQWEYAYRAGTDTPFPTGTDPRSLRGHGNLADQFGSKHGLNGCLGWLEDGNAVTAPVGSYRPNAWGLHDMVGNVSEWVLDTSRTPDHSRWGQNLAERRTRGGHWHSLADMARAARWAAMPGDTRSAQIGVRPARLIEH